MVAIKAPNGKVISYNNMAEAKAAMIKASKKYKWNLSDFKLSEDDGDSWRNTDIYDFSGIERPSKKKAKKKAPHWTESFSPTVKKAVEERIAGRAGLLNLAQAIVEDGLSTPGRGVAALADAILNSKDGESFKDSYIRSLALKQGEKSEDLKERTWLGDMAQDFLRDPMLIPSMAIGGPISKVPGLATMGKGATSAAGKFAKADIAKPAIVGALQGLATEAARPVMTTSKFDPEKLAEGAAMGAGMSTAFHNLGGAAKSAVAGAKRVVKGKEIVGDIKSQLATDKYRGLTEEDILAKIERDYGIKLDDPVPNTAAKKEPRGSLWESVQAALAGEEPSLKETAAFMANANRISPEALLKATSPKGLAEIKGAYRSPLQLADEIVERLDKDNLVAKDAATWNAYLDEATQSGRTINTAEIAKILNEPAAEIKARKHGAMEIEKPMLERLKGYAQVFESKDGPSKMSPRELNQFRQTMGESVDWDVLEANGFTKQEINTLKRAYGKSREELLADAIANDRSDAATAYERMGEDLTLREAALRVLNAGNIKDAQKSRIATTLKNKGNLNDSNAPKTEELFEVLERLDKRLGTDITKKSKNAYYANQLSPEGEIFEIPDYNPSVTGKGFETSAREAASRGKTARSAFINTAEAKAKAIKKAGEPPKRASGVTPYADLDPSQKEFYDWTLETQGKKAADYYAAAAARDNAKGNPMRRPQ